MEYVFDLKPVMDKQGRFFNKNHTSHSVEGAETPWIYASGARGMSRCSIPLRGENDDSGKYIVKVHLAELDESQAGKRIFDIKLQGEVVAEDIDVVKEAGAAKHALVYTFAGIDVERKLDIELIAKSGQPIISAVEVKQE